MTTNNDKPSKKSGKSVHENVRPICVLCGNLYRDWGHNAWPLAQDGRCCDDCNTSKVVPARIARMHEGRGRE